MTIKELLGLSAQLGGDSPSLDTELLLAHCLGRTRSYLYTWPERVVDHDCETRFRALMSRRAAGEPVAYLLGAREFWSLPLVVDASTLIPRPDTERLVEVALEVTDHLLAELGETGGWVLDLGTGTGAIALAIASERPQWRLTGVDVNPAAVELARRNAGQLGLSNVQIHCSDWFGSIAPGCRFHAVVSNPPYIAADDSHLDQGDVRFEPRSALVAAQAGLADLSHIVAEGQAHLLAGGWLLCEHGAGQGAAVRGLLSAAGYTAVQTWRDYGGHERVSGGRRAGGEQTERST